MKRYAGLFFCFLVPLTASASVIVPTGISNNLLYYRIGGGSDYYLPPVSDTNPIRLSATVDLGLGNQCGMFNPAISISNSLNDLQDSVNNLTQSLIANATGSLAEMPMYFLAQANPTMYDLLTNSLINAHALISASVKSCQVTKDQIAQGKNPYQDWGTLSIGNSWRQHLSLTAASEEDINDAQEAIEQHAGDDGVPWVQGSTGADGGLYAAGKNQPPVNVVADTTKAGYNALLNRDLSSEQPAPTSSELYSQFPSPSDAVSWITNVVGDQTITTCMDNGCRAAQGSVAGRGLLPWVMTCTTQNKNDCVDTLTTRLQDLVTGSTPVTKENLLAVSAEDLVISPSVVTTLKGMDPSQQGIFIHKLAEEVAAQRLIDKALVAYDILQTGSQVPVIATNHPAQVILQEKTAELDADIRAINFESQVRKQMMSDTLLSLMNYSNSQQQQAFDVGKVNRSQPMMENSAIPSTSGAHS